MVVAEEVDGVHMGTSEPHIHSIGEVAMFHSPGSAVAENRMAFRAALRFASVS